MTKKFTAEEFNKQPAPVYRAADKDGSVEISHTHYPDSVFVMEFRDSTEKAIARTGEEMAKAASKIWPTKLDEVQDD